MLRTLFYPHLGQPKHLGHDNGEDREQSKSIYVWLWERVRARERQRRVCDVCVTCVCVCVNRKCVCVRSHACMFVCVCMHGVYGEHVSTARPEKDVE